jgi:glycerol-3-phosphate dehydrogenase
MGPGLNLDPVISRLPPGNLAAAGAETTERSGLAHAAHAADAPLAARQRAAALAALGRAEGFDLAVIGGGATGLAIALQATWASRSVALVEAGDFAGGTSSRSTKLLHGGVRYLAQGRIGLVREALHERAALIGLAPRLARPLRFVMPAYRWWERAFYGLGLWAYDRLAGSASLGPTRQLSGLCTRRDYPKLVTRGLRGAVSYCDAQFDDAGLALAMARGAAQAGAVIVNRVQAIGVIESGGQVCGVSVRDRETDAQITIHARDVVNAAGVWVDALRTGAPMVEPSQGAHIVVARTFFPADEALLLPRTADGRVLFIVPWLDHCVIGTTDTPRSAAELPPLAEPLPFAEEIDLILAEVGRVLSPAPSRADILSAWAGLRPLVRPAQPAAGGTGGSAGRTGSISREHAIEVAGNGLTTITGGKWTTCLAMARDLLRALPHGPIDIDAATAQALPADAPDCAARAPTADEVRWLAEHTWARTVEDVLARRSRLLFLDVRAALAAAPAVAAALGEATGQDPDLEGFRLLASSWLARLQP